MRMEARRSESRRSESRRSEVRRSEVRRSEAREATRGRSAPAVRRAVAVAASLALAVVAAVPAVASVHDDPAFSQQWALSLIGAPESWERATGASTTIAIVDTGADLDHEDLASKIVDDVSCIGSEGDPQQCGGSGQDDHGHGSHVAGIAAAATGNGLGVAGTAPDAGILVVRVLEDDGTGQASGTVGDVRAGIRWAVDHGADVVNLSLGENVLLRQILGTGLEEAIRYAWDEGVVPVIATGNTDTLFGGSGYGDLPAVVVTATNRDDQQASYATDVGDARWGMAAPGGEPASGDDAWQEAVLSTYWEDDDDQDDDDQDGDDQDDYASAAGTSMAAPHVSGAAVTLRAAGLSPADTVQRLLDTAVDVGPAGDDSQTGAGRLDLAAATAGLSDGDGGGGNGGTGGGTSSSTTAPPQGSSSTTAPPPPPGGETVSPGGGSGEGSEGGGDPGGDGAQPGSASSVPGGGEDGADGGDAGDRRDRSDDVALDRGGDASGPGGDGSGEISAGWTLATLGALVALAGAGVGGRAVTRRRRSPLP